MHKTGNMIHYIDLAMLNLAGQRLE